MKLGEVLIAAAVLSALTFILWPVHSGDYPGAMRVSTLSNMKQLGLGVLIYQGDFDEAMPSAFAEIPNRTRTAVAYFPADRDPAAPKRAREASKRHWANAILPYIKNDGVYRLAGAPDGHIGPTPSSQTPRSGVSFNGLLHRLNGTTIAHPEEVPLFTHTMGFANMVGYAYSNPVLDCDPFAPCTYRTAKRLCVANGGSSRLRTLRAPQFGGKRPYQLVSRVDGSAKSVGVSPSGPFWSALDGNGRGIAYHADSTGCHPYRFRPDYEPKTDPPSRSVSL